jgi:hypothetical protein
MKNFKPPIGKPLELMISAIITPAHGRNVLITGGEDSDLVHNILALHKAIALAAR